MSELADQIQIPPELSIIQYINERKIRCGKFTREYDDYKRFRKVVKSKGQQGQNIDHNRYTYRFVQRLIQECRDLKIPIDNAYDYTEDILVDDLKAFSQWKELAVELIKEMQGDENTFEDEQLKEKFLNLKKQMRIIPIYDKDIYNKFQCVDWLFQCKDLLEEDKDLSVENIDAQKVIQRQQFVYWDNLIKQVDKYLPYFPDIQEHSLYQRTIWEVQQAKDVIEFVVEQKDNIKNLGAKFNLDKQQNYAFFRNKNSRAKIAKMLDIAERSKIDIRDELKYLQNWINAFDEYTTMYHEGRLYDEMSFDKLKDILRMMYLSPIDYGEIFFKLKERIDTAEMIKLNLKRILAEHEDAVQHQKNREEIGAKKRRLRYSRIQYDLKLFKKSGNISGIKEVEIMQEKVDNSINKLQQIKEIISQIDFDNLKEDFIQKNYKLEQAKLLFVQLEIDMEDREKEVHRLIFESSLKLIFYSLENHKRKLTYEDFKDLDKTYERLRDYVKDDQIISKFIVMRNKANDYARKITRSDSKEELDIIKKEVEQEIPLIDFTQLITDKGAKIMLGKRKQVENNKIEEISDQEQSLDKVIKQTKNKRQKLNDKNSQSLSNKESDSDNSSSNSDSQSESDSSSGSDSGSSSSGSGSSSGSSSGSDSGSESDSESEEERQTLAQGRSRRKIVPNVSSDFIYQGNTVKKIQQRASQQEAKDKSDGSNSSSSSDENSQSDNEESKDSKEKQEERNRRKLKKKQKRRQERIEQKKKEKMQRQLAEYRLSQNKSQQTIQQRTKLNQRLDQSEQPISMSSQIAVDQDLQGYLQKMKIKIRDDTKQRFLKALNETQPVFSELKEEEKKQIVNDIENQIHTKHPEVDSYYKIKANDTCTNIKYLGQYKEIQEMVVKTKIIQLFRLFQPHHSFKDFVQQKWQIVLEKQKQQALQKQEETRKQKELQRQKQQKEMDRLRQTETNREVQVPQNQQLMKALYSTNNTQEQGKLQQSQEIDKNEPQQKIKVENVDSDLDNSDSDADDNSGAMFSDPEDIPPPVNNQTFSNQNIYQGNQRQPFGQLQNNQFNNQQMGRQQQQQQMMYQQQIQPQPYNPYEYQNGRYNSAKSVDPILYDPIRAKTQSQVQQNQEKNLVPPGSLLKVWEGILEISKDLQPLVQFFSTVDIQIFQQLPKLPSSIMLKGKSNIPEVTTHFLRLRKERKLIRGWITRKGQIGTLDNSNSQTQSQPSSGNWQENSDKYTKLFEELDQSNKAALFDIFQGVKLYIVPITSKTKDFCRQMGIYPEPIIPPQNQQNSVNNQLEIDQSIHEETHCYAVLCQIKQTFNNRLSFLNPDVLRVAEIVQQQDSQQTDTNLRANDNGGFSPISSDEERENKQSQNKTNVQQTIKQEDPTTSQYDQQHSHDLYDATNPQLIMKQDTGVFSAPIMSDQQQQLPNLKNEEGGGGSKIDIDDLINKFKNQELDVQSIQEKLMPLIFDIKGEDEAKLTQFLEELIQKCNANPQIIQEQQIPNQSQGLHQQVKQEQMGIQMPQNQFQQQLQQPQMMMSGQMTTQFGMQPQGVIPGNMQMFNQNQQMPSQYNPMMNQQSFGGMQPGQIRPQSQQNLMGIGSAPGIYSQQHMNPGMGMNQMGMPTGQPNMFAQNPSMIQPGSVPPLRPPPQQMNINPMMLQMGQQMPPQQFGVDPKTMQQIMINPMTGLPFTQQQLQQQQFRQQFPNQQQPRR